MFSLAAWSIYQVKLIITIIRQDENKTEIYTARDIAHQWVKQTKTLKKRFIHLFLNSWKTVIRIIIFITSTNEFMSFIPFLKIYILKRNSQTQSRYCFGSRNFVRAVAGICVGSDFSSFISLKNSRPCCFGLHYTVQALLYIYSAAVNLSGYNTAFCSLLFLQLRQELPSDIYLHIVSVFELSR